MDLFATLSPAQGVFDTPESQRALEPASAIPVDMEGNDSGIGGVCIVA
jgi:hypothetical protein